MFSSRRLTPRPVPGDTSPVVSDPTWYHAVGGSPVGPVTQADLLRLLGKGEITLETWVFEEGMTDWAPLRQAMADVLPETVAPAPAPAAAPLPAPASVKSETSAPAPARAADDRVPCAKCHQAFPPGMMVERNGFRICALCDRSGPVR